MAEHPLVAATLAIFPDAEIRDVRKVGAAQANFDGNLDDHTDADDTAPADGDEI